MTKHHAHRALPVLVLTEHAGLLDDLLRLCAAAGADAEVVHSGPVPAATWERAPLVLAGEDWAAWAAARPDQEGVMPRRPGVLLASSTDDPALWAHGVAIGAEQVLRVPDDEARLTERIADAVEQPGRPALTVGTLGGRGGAGASTLACALSVTAARSGGKPVLIDADPLGGGLDIPLTAERFPGPRWPAFTSARGRLSGAALTDALPCPHGVSLLSWDRAAAAPPGSEAMRSVLAAARRRASLVVVDLPRTLDDATTVALASLDLVFLVVPTELRALGAARRTVDTTASFIRDLRLIARVPAGGGALAPPEMAGLLGLPLAGELPQERELTASCDAGHPPGSDTSGPLARLSAGLLREMMPADEPARGGEPNGPTPSADRASGRPVQEPGS